MPPRADPVATPDADLLGDPAYPRLKDFIIEETGLAYYADRDPDLVRRLQVRLVHLGQQSATDYLGLLQRPADGRGELDALVEELTIGETYFFRYHEQFDALCSRVIPDLIERARPRRTLRIWSAGCATGPEPYSLAILLRQHFADALAGWRVDILATDINHGFLAQARQGRFPDRALRALPAALRDACFRHDGRDWVIDPAYREWIRFEYLNLARHPFPNLVQGLAALDMILCRNVLIYFDAQRAGTIVAGFHRCLLDGGWLVTGHAELGMPVFDGFERVNAEGAILLRRPVAGSSPAPAGDEPGGHGATRAPGAHERPAAHTPVGRDAAPCPPPASSGPQLSLPLPRNRTPEPAPQEDASAFEDAPTASPIDCVRRLAGAGRWDEALTACDAALQAAAHLDPRAHFYRALILNQAGDIEGAARCIENALYLDRRFVVGHYHAGLLHLRRRRLQPARRAFANALRLVADQPADAAVADGDGISAAQLRDLAEMHLEMLER